MIVLKHNSLGLGDAVCLTPAFRELRRTGWNHIVLQVSAERVPLISDVLHDNRDVAAVVSTTQQVVASDNVYVTDIEHVQWDYEHCSCGGDVSKSRPRVFLDYLGLSGAVRLRTAITEQTQTQSRRVFIQRHAAERWKECSQKTMDEIAQLLAQQNYECVYEPDGSVQCRVEAVATCSLAVGFDSFYLHLCAALDVPFIALLGPANCTGRVVDYPYAVRCRMRCRKGRSCFRNREIACAVTKARATSWCLENVDVNDFSRALQIVEQW